MTIPAFGAAGSGVTATLGATAAIGYPASISAGHTLWIHTLSLVSLAGYDDTAILAAGFTLAPGGDVTFNTIHRSRVYRKTATGSESGTISVTSPTLGTVKAIMYRTTGSISGPEYCSTAFTTNGTDASIEMPTVPVCGEAAGIAFIAVADDNALASATGETGGDWTESVAEYADATGDDGALQLQMTSLVAGPVVGGSQTMAASDAWCVIAFAIRNARQVRIGIDASTSNTPVVDVSVTYAQVGPYFSDDRTIVSIGMVSDSSDGWTTDTMLYDTSVGMTQIEDLLQSGTGQDIQLQVAYINEADLNANGNKTMSFAGTGTPGATSTTAIHVTCFEGVSQDGPAGSDGDTAAGATVATNDITAAVAGQMAFSVAMTGAGGAGTSFTHSDSQNEVLDTTLTAEAGSTVTYALTMKMVTGSETTYSSTAGTSGQIAKVTIWWDENIVEIPTTVDESMAAFVDAATAAVAEAIGTTVAESMAAFVDAATVAFLDVYTGGAAESMAAFLDEASVNVEQTTGGRFAFVWDERYHQ